MAPRRSRNYRHRRIPKATTGTTRPTRYPAPEAHSLLSASVALSALSGAAYLNAIRDSFTYDDAFVSPLALRPSWQRIVELFQRDSWYGLDFPGPLPGNYRPLSMSSIVFESLLHGGRGAYLHATAVVLHITTTLVLFGFLRALLRGAPGSVSQTHNNPQRGFDIPTVSAWVAALIFGVHPVHVDAVASYYNRSEVIVTGCTYGILWLLWSRDEQRPNTWWHAAALFFVALLSKESASTAPLLIVLLYVLFRPAPWRTQVQRLRPLAYFAIPYACYAWLRSNAVPWPSGAGSRIVHYLAMQTWGQRLSTVSSVLADGLFLMVWPHPLRCSYDAYVPHDVALATALHIALIGVAVAARTRLPAITFAVAASYIGVTPSTPLMQDFSLYPGTFAERHLYLPSAGLSVALAYGLAALARHRGRNAVFAIGAACWIAFVPLCFRRNQDWESNLRLFEADYRIDPANGHNAALLARTYVALDQVDSAIRICDNFFRTQPRGVKMLDACAMVYQRAGRIEDTIAMHRGSFELTGIARPLMDIARLRLNLGDRVAAEAEFERAIAATENPVNRHIRRGEMLLRLYPERAAEARAEFEAALALDPSSDAARDWLRRVRPSR